MLSASLSFANLRCCSIKQVRRPENPSGRVEKAAALGYSTDFSEVQTQSISASHMRSSGLSPLGISETRSRSGADIIIAADVYRSGSRTRRSCRLRAVQRSLQIASGGTINLKVRATILRMNRGR